MATYDADPWELYRSDAAESEDSVLTPLFACTHVGHGTNSYFLGFKIVWNGQQIGDQYGWGGIYGNRVGARQRVAEAIIDLHQQFDTLNGYDPSEFGLEAAVARAGRNAARRTGRAIEK